MKKIHSILFVGKLYPGAFGIDGIAISPYSSHFDVVYYSPLASYHLYSVYTKTLIEAGLIGGNVPLQDFQVRDHGVRSSQADGMIMDSSGCMFYGRLNRNAVMGWKSQANVVNARTEYEIAQSGRNLEWIDAFAFDNLGSLLVTSNRLDRFIGGEYDLREYNFRIGRIRDSRHRVSSYMHPF